MSYKEYQTIPRRFDIIATLALFGTMCCWGVAPVMLRYLAKYDYVPDGFTSNFVRYPIGALLYLPLLIHAARNGKLGKLWLLALIPAIPNVGAQTLWAWAPYHLEVDRIVFLVRLSVVWSILGAFFLFPDERRLVRSRAFWSGAVLSVAGFAIMAAASENGAHGIPMAGTIIMLFCGVFYALYGVAVRYVMGDQSPFLTFAVVGVYSAIALAMMAPLGEPSSVSKMPPVPLFIFIISAVIGISGGHGCYYVAVQRIGVAASALTLAATPFVSALVAFLWLDEGMKAGEWGGAAMLVVGSLLAVRSQQQFIPAGTEPHREEQCAQP